MNARDHLAGAHIAELDGLRALAVIPVIAYHFGADVNGPAGVTVFFALSGYIVTTVLLREHDRAGRIELSGFYLRRFRRLLPASTLVVVATVVVGWLLSKPPITRQALAAITYWADFERFGNTYSYGHSGYAPLEHFWSLAIEEQFYLVLPLACLLLLRFGRRHLGVVVVVGMIASVWFAEAGRSNPQMYFHPAARVCELLVGVLLALSGRRVRSVWGYVALAVLLAILAGLVHPLPIVTAALTCIVIAGLPRALASSPLVVIGRYSYGLYLWHPLAAVLANAWSVRVVLTATITALSYHLVEHPVRFTLSRPRAVTAMAVMSTVSLAVVLLPFGRLSPKFIPPAPAAAAAPTPTPASAPAHNAVGTDPATTSTATSRPLRISGAGDSTQMFMDSAWESFAAANPQSFTWIEPPMDLAVWTSGADDWIRTASASSHLYLAHDGPQGGLDRQGCPLVYDLPIRPTPQFDFFAAAKLHGAVPIASCDWHLWIPQALARMHLDVLVVSWSVTASWEYRMSDGHVGFVGDPGFDELLTASMAEFEKMAARYGTKVLWTTYQPLGRTDPNATQRWALGHTADLMADVVLRRECAADLRSFVRSDPTFNWYQDGFHFSAEGAATAVAWIANSMRSCVSRSAAAGAHG